MKSALLTVGIFSALVSCSSPAKQEPSVEPTSLEVRTRGPITLEESGANLGEFQVMSRMLRDSSWFASILTGAPFTILAASDASLADLDRDVLERITSPAQLDSVMGFHVLPGKLTAHQLSKFTRIETLGGQRLHVSDWNGTVEISGTGSQALGLAPAHIVEADILLGDGIMHIMDGVALPSTKSIGEIVRNSQTLTQLCAAAKFSGVAGVLEGEGPMTLFAPTEEAFAALDPEVAKRLMDPSNRKELLTVLQRHIVPGRLYADQFHTGTMSGFGSTELEFTWSSTGFFVEGARIVHTDVEATNGVVHLIDRLLVD